MYVPSSSTLSNHILVSLNSNEVLEVCFKVHVGLSVEFGSGYPVVYAGFQAASNLGMHSCVVLTRDCS